MKKIISYTLFGEDLKYYAGAEKNILLNKEFLPDWETVIYYSSNRIREGYVEKLRDLGATMIDVINLFVGTKHSSEFPYFWRFYTFFVDGLNLVRDLDSRMSDREVEYIRRWEQNDRKYFIIRDHPWHAPVPSGLFGIKGFDQQFSIHFNDYIQNNNLVWGTDQDILYKYIENIDENEIFYCGYDRVENYIPRNNPNFFIGMQLDEKDEPTKPSGEECLRFIKELNL